MRPHQTIFELSRGNFRAIDHLALAAVHLAAEASAAAVSAGEVIAARRSLCL